MSAADAVRRSHTSATGAAWKLPPETSVPRLREDHRVVGRGVHLDLDDASRVRGGVARRAVHLRDAAERVGVLHDAAVAVALAQGRVREERPEVPRRCDLAGMRAGRVDARVERGVRALQNVQRQGRDEVRRLEEAQGAVERERADRRRELRPVDEREPLLRLENGRREARRPQRLGGRAALPAPSPPPLPRRARARGARAGRGLPTRRPSPAPE